MRILKLFLLTAGLSLLVLASCDLFIPKTEPGSRNYEWTLDTLYMPMNYISSVWGASPDDVWAVGAGGTEYDRLLHYDGTRWSTYTNEIIWCDGRIIFGFCADDIWMGGQAGWLERGAGIWHYDGQQWKQHYVYSPEEPYRAIYIHDIWGSSPDNVYACGLRTFYDETNIFLCKGFVLHYDGTAWRELARADFNSQFLRVRNENEIVYVTSYTIDPDTLSGGDYEFYQVKNDSSFYKIGSYKESKIRWIGLSSIDEKVYLTIGQNAYRYKKNKFKHFLYVDNEKFYNNVYGRSENDVFLSMRDGIMHYNGEDIEYIYESPSNDMDIFGTPLILENDIFYSVRYPGFNELVLHGRLVEE